MQCTNCGNPKVIYKREQSGQLLCKDCLSKVFLAYTLNFKLSEIPENKILILNDMQWAYFILYNRDKLKGLEHTSLYKQCKNLKESHDVIIGPIADDVMNHTISDFLNNNISFAT